MIVSSYDFQLYRITTSQFLDWKHIMKAQSDVLGMQHHQQEEEGQLPEAAPAPAWTGEAGNSATSKLATNQMLH